MSNPSRPNPAVSPTRQQLDDLEALMQRMLSLPVYPDMGSDSLASANSENDPDDDAQYSQEPEPGPDFSMDDGFQTIMMDVPAQSDPGNEPSEEPAPENASLPEPPIPKPVYFSFPQVKPESPGSMPARPSWYSTHSGPDAAHSEPVQGADPFPNSLSMAGSPLRVLEEPQEERDVEDQPTAVLDGTTTMSAGPSILWRRPPVAWWLQPLVWVNDAFDLWIGRCGSLGRWLRGRRGRAFLGWLGLLLLVGSLTWGMLDWMGWTW